VRGGGACRYFDQDKSGQLDKAEFAGLHAVRLALGSLLILVLVLGVGVCLVGRSLGLGSHAPTQDLVKNNMTTHDLESCFAELDTDGSGTKEGAR
jgi:hypothetical protein